MTALECLRILRKGFLCLFIWNLVITATLLLQYFDSQNEKLNTQICNLEAIPDYEIVEEY